MNRFNWNGLPKPF